MAGGIGWLDPSGRLKQILHRDAANRFISDHYGHRASPLAVLGKGEWSQAYAFTLDGQDAVARFGLHGEDFAKDQLMSGFRSPRLPIPKVWEVGETPQGYFAVSERFHGVLLDDLDASRLRLVLPDLLAVLDAVREIDVSDREGYGGWSPNGTGAHRTWREALLKIADDQRLPGWRAALEGSSTGAGPYDSALARLRALAAEIPDVKQVIHGDLLYHNVLVQGAEVRGIFDWGNSMYGDGLYDAAWLIYWWPWYPAWTAIDIRAELDRHWAAGGTAPGDVEHRLRCYQLRIGLDAMSYNAFTGRWDELARNAQQTLALAAG